MKAHFLLLAALLFAGGVSQAQSKKPNRIFQKGQTDLKIGVGLVPTYVMDGAKINMLPISLELNRLLGDHFSVGAIAGYSASQSNPSIVSDGILQGVKNLHYQFGLKGGIHITKWDNVDWYGGFQLAYNLSKITMTEGDREFMIRHLRMKEKRSKITYTGFVGGRYAFSRKLSLFGEAGFGVSLLTVGLSTKL